MKPIASKRRIRIVGEILLIAFAYWVLARLGQLVAIHPGNVTPVWPASGFALAVVMWRGYRVWPGVWLGSFFGYVHSFFDATTAFNFMLTGSAIGIGATLQACLGAFLVQRFCSPRLFDRPADVFLFIALQFVACLSSATIGTLALAVGGVISWSPSGDVWFTWYTGDSLGIILVAPILLNLRQLAERISDRKKLVEPISSMLLITIGSWLIFSGTMPSPLLYLLLPFILWAAVRGGPLAVSLSVLSAFTIAIYFISRGDFYVFENERNRTIITIQGAAAAMALTGLTVSAALAELRHSEANISRALSEAKTSAAKYKTLLACAPEAIVILDVDVGRFIDANENAEKLFGLSRTELLKKHPADLSPELQPDGKASSQSASERIAEALCEESGAFDWTHHNADGQPIPCEVRLTRLPSNDQRLIRASIIDVSARREMKRQLRDSMNAADTANQRLRLALKAGNVGLWDWDMTTNEVFYSDQFKRQLGYGPDTPMNSYQDWESRLHPDDRESALKSIADYLAEQSSEYAPVFRMRHQNGTYRWILSQGEVIRDSAGKPTRMLGLHTDVTELKSTQEALEKYSRELEKRNAELDSFAYVASHDLKAPLRGVRQLAEWIGEDCFDMLPDDSKRHLEQIIERVDRLDNLLADLLMYSRAGRMHGSQSIVDVHALVEEIVQSIAVPDEFQISINADIPEILTFRTPLTQVLSNLITNAIKHHDKESGTVVVAVEQAKDYLMFRVQDDGPGIAPQFHERVFEMFETLKPRDGVESTGIGLAVVKKTVESYDGRVQIESTGNRGTTISFTWPKQMKLLDGGAN